MVGSALLRALRGRGYANIVARSHQQLDLADQAATHRFMREMRPQYVFLAAAKVGGILANSQQPVAFLYENLLIQNHLIYGAYESGVRKLLFLGSSCIYPRLAPQPIKEEYLLSSPLEPTNEWYAIAKIAGLKLCDALRRQHQCDFICVMPPNIYGANDHYNLQTSHVLPAFIRKFHEANIARASAVTCWGTGSPFREFLHCDDLAQACVFLMENYSDAKIINAGAGSDISIRDLAELIKKITGYTGGINWDNSKPDGTPRKLLDSSRITALGWKPGIDLPTGIRLAYDDFLKNQQ
jgi:GDP-L-fucose synthase